MCVCVCKIVLIFDTFFCNCFGSVSSLHWFTWFVIILIFKSVFYFIYFVIIIFFLSPLFQISSLDIFLFYSSCHSAFLFTDTETVLRYIRTRSVKVKQRQYNQFELNRIERASEGTRIRLYRCFFSFFVNWQNKHTWESFRTQVTFEATTQSPTGKFIVEQHREATVWEKCENETVFFCCCYFYSWKKERKKFIAKRNLRTKIRKKKKKKKTITKTERKIKSTQIFHQLSKIETQTNWKYFRKNR